MQHNKLPTNENYTNNLVSSVFSTQLMHQFNLHITIHI